MIGTCFFNHAQISFEGAKCPLCAEVDKSYETQANLESKIEGLQAQIASMENATRVYKHNHYE